MSQLILDMGSGNTCHNCKEVVKQMIWEAAANYYNDKHEIILKWQLFKDAPPNVPLDHDVFEYAYKYAHNLGIETTASVFDIDSLRFLMQYEVPFIKIACRPELYELMEAVENVADQHGRWGYPAVYVSTSESGLELPGATMLACIPKYPATIEDYEGTFSHPELKHVSDHTVGWGLYWKWKPDIIEKHFVHVREEGNPDAGPFAVTPDELMEIM